MTIHRGHDPVRDPRRDASAQCRQQVLHDGGLIRREAVEHEITQHRTRYGRLRPDADAKPGVLHRAQRLLDAAQTVVATRRTLRAKPERPERESDVVHDHQQVVGDRPEGALRVRRERVAAQVHERLRLQQSDPAAIQLAIRGARVRHRAPRGQTPNVGQVVNDPPADVVTRSLVFGTRIAETDDELHGSRLA